MTEPTSWSPALDPDALLARVGAGDRAAFSELYDQMVDVVFGLCRRLLRNSALAEEVAQEAFLEIWRTAPRFDPVRGSAKAYMITVAHRRAVDRIRSEEASRARTERVAARQQTRDIDLVSEQVERESIQSEVRAAMGVLSDLQRQAIEMAYFDGMTQSEIATALDVPLGTVKSRMRDGMTRLSATMGPST